MAMDFLVNNIAAGQIIKSVLLGVSLLVAIVIVFYNWLYLVRVLSSYDKTDLSPPKNIERLVKASIFTALFTVFLILIIFLLRIY
jgi:hypothetical protein